VDAYLDRFGFLNWRRTIEFDGGSLAPVPEFDEAAVWVDSHTNHDGFLYPGMSPQLDPKTNKIVDEVPRAKRPALLHPIWASHTLTLADLETTEELRRGIGALVIHLLGYLFGIRLQFSGWWFDGRVPIRLQATHAIYISEATVQDFLSHCCRTWRGWTEEERRLLINALFMHCRAPSYEWDWERFAIEYMVLDACWKLAELRRRVKKTKLHRHADQIHILCRAFGIPLDDNLVADIVRLRNELFHEALWDGSQPCTDVGSATFLQPYNLRRLNQRLIPELLEYETPYIRTNWWSIDTFGFDPPSRHINP
jgi:hypothetical protein